MRIAPTRSDPDLLEQVPGRARQNRIQLRLVVAERGEHQAGHLGRPRPDLPADRHPVTIGQPDIQQGHVGAQRQNAGQRGRDGARLADHLDVRLGPQQAADTPADDLLVVQDEHADRRSRRIVGRAVAHRSDT
jgi:hypothetical protein